MTSHEKELVGYVLAEMLNGDQVKQLCRDLGLTLPAGTRTTQSRALADHIRFSDLEVYCHQQWQRPRADIHLTNLKSGVLSGFSWHDLAPSRLHLGLQGHVRRVAAGEIPLAQFLSIGADVIRKEYAMVAMADLTEITLVDKCGGTPPLRSKSVSDVVLNGYPFDVKNGAVPKGWTATSMRANRAGFAREMITGADPERMREQARRAYNVWALNRLFVNVVDEIRWMKEPEDLLADLAQQVTSLGDPMELKFGSSSVLAHVIVI